MATDEKTYTEREKVLAEREAFVNGSCWRHARECHITTSPRTPVEEGAAAEHYPLPKVTREREVTDVHNPRITWCVRGGEIVGYDCEHTISHGHSAFTPYARRIEQWSDLLANPTEEAES